MAETTCGKCMYFDLPYDEFPCDVCLNKMKDVEDALPANWPPEDKDILEQVKDCENCRFCEVSISKYPCSRCVEEPNYEKFWEPEEETPENWIHVTVTSAGTSPNCTVEVKKAPKPFWIVCVEDGRGWEAHVRHETEKSATDEANRLALKTGKTFQVFKSVAKVTGKTTASQENYA